MIDNDCRQKYVKDLKIDDSSQAISFYNLDFTRSEKYTLKPNPDDAVGDVIEPGTGRVLAGPRKSDESEFLSTSQLLKGEFKEAVPPFNTVIGVVATDAKLSKVQASKLAYLAQIGIARTIDPCHTMYDGDTLFALSTGNDKEADINALGAAAAEVVTEAIVRAIGNAEALAGLPAAKDVIRC